MQRRKLIILSFLLGIGLLIITIVKQLNAPDPNEVLVCRSTIRRATPLSFDMLEWKLLPKAQADTALFHRNSKIDAESLNSYVALKRINKGAIITNDLVVSKSSTYFVSQLIEPGKRAFSIDLAPHIVNTSGGILAAGNRVDISHAGTLVLVAVKILSVIPPNESSKNYGLVLEVLEHQVEMLRSIDDDAQVSFSLVSPSTEQSDEEKMKLGAEDRLGAYRKPQILKIN
jgi:Flp pilus assembly protein CpaB